MRLTDIVVVSVSSLDYQNPLFECCARSTRQPGAQPSSSVTVGCRQAAEFKPDQRGQVELRASKTRSVIHRDNGVSIGILNLLQNFRAEASRIQYYITRFPLIERRALLKSVVLLSDKRIRISDYIGCLMISSQLERLRQLAVAGSVYRSNVMSSDRPWLPFWLWLGEAIWKSLGVTISRNSGNPSPIAAALLDFSDLSPKIFK
jgi:hypothetical protein